MKIIPLRSMCLSGQPVAQGVSANVSEEDAAQALRHGWAIEAPTKLAKADKAAAEAQAKAEAAALSQDEAAALAQAEAQAAANARNPD